MHILRPWRPLVLAFFDQKWGKGWIAGADRGRASGRGLAETAPPIPLRGAGSPPEGESRRHWQPIRKHTLIRDMLGRLSHPQKSRRERA
jgi:hypothetical protein